MTPAPLEQLDRTALIESSISQLASEGAWAFTSRQVGDRCGLSSMKVAKYLKDTGRYEKVYRFRWIPMEDEG